MGRRSYERSLIFHRPPFQSPLKAEDVAFFDLTQKQWKDMQCIVRMRGIQMAIPSQVSPPRSTTRDPPACGRERESDVDALGAPRHSLPQWLAHQSGNRYEDHQWHPNGQAWSQQVAYTQPVES